MEPRTRDPHSVVDQASSYHHSPYCRGLKLNNPVKPIHPPDFQAHALDLKPIRGPEGLRRHPSGKYLAEVRIDGQVKLWLPLEEPPPPHAEAALALRGAGALSEAFRVGSEASSSETIEKSVANIKIFSHPGAPLIQPSDNIIHNSGFHDDLADVRSGTNCTLLKHVANTKIRTFHHQQSVHIIPPKPLIQSSDSIAFHDSVPEVRIDILKEIDDAEHYTHQMITHESWKEHIHQLMKSRLDNISPKMMNEATLMLTGQAVGAVMNTVLTSPSSSSSHIVTSAIILGLSLTLAGISLRGTRRVLSVLMRKVGAIATASAIVISFGSNLPLLMGWIFGPVAFLVISVAVIFA